MKNRKGTTFVYVSTPQRSAHYPAVRSFNAAYFRNPVQKVVKNGLRIVWASKCPTNCWKQPSKATSML